MTIIPFEGADILSAFIVGIFIGFMSGLIFFVVLFIIHNKLFDKDGVW
jgi:hypothetical protein